MLFLVEPVGLAEMRGDLQLAVMVEGPAVIAALQDVAMTLAVADQGGGVRADDVEAARRPSRLRSTKTRKPAILAPT